jgi:hypothetical protein
MARPVNERLRRGALALLLALPAGSAAAQPVYLCTGGTVTFFSQAPLEDIEATSRAMHSVFNAATGEIVFIVPLRSFHFRKSLMEEHFNERYVESDKYPQAVYKGKLRQAVDLSRDGEYPLVADGTLALHNVERPRTDTARLVVAGGKITLAGRFRVAVADHAIEIPRLMSRNIAEVVEVTFSATYMPYRKED